MLTTQIRSQFVTKILTSQTGEQFKVVFLVALVNGQVRAQVVSAQPLSKAAKAATPCLPVCTSKQSVTYTYKKASTLVVSPFTSLFFFNSQPTRAPSL